MIVSIFLSALNSFSLSGKVVDNINDSALASVSRLITPVFKPIGVHEDNWQANRRPVYRRDGEKKWWSVR